jgi:hypothetical protein
LGKNPVIFEKNCFSGECGKTIGRFWVPGKRVASSGMTNDILSLFWQLAFYKNSITVNVALLKKIYKKYILLTCAVVVLYKFCLAV